MTTVRDLAKAADVSPATVSFVLSGRKGVAAQTRRRVELAIERLGYQRQGVGRPARKTGLQIAVICGGALHGSSQDGNVQSQGSVQPSHRFTLQRDWMRGIQDQLRRTDDNFSFYAGFRHVDDAQVLQSSITHGEIDGIILAQQKQGDGFLEWLAQQPAPYVVINRRPKHPERFSFVEMDNWTGGWQAATHFLNEGHRRIALVTSAAYWGYNQRRAAGFLDALSNASVEPIYYREVPILSPDQVAEHADAIIECGATATFASTDSLAMACLNHWHDQGVKVPQQMSLIGFDNAGATSNQGLFLSSIGYDRQGLGRVAVNMLRQLIDSRELLANLTSVLTTRMVIADTTAPPQV